MEASETGATAPATAVGGTGGLAGPQPGGAGGCGTQAPGRDPSRDQSGSWINDIEASAVCLQEQRQLVEELNKELRQIQLQHFILQSSAGDVQLNNAGILD